MTDPLDATGIAFMPLEIERLKRSKTWRQCRSQPFLAYYVVNLWMAAFHGVPAGSLEDDDEALCELACCSPLEWPSIRPVALHRWQKREDGRLYHPIVESKAREALSLRKSSKHHQVRKTRELSDLSAPDTFESWYAEYPRKVARGAARTAYAVALKKTGVEVLLESVKRYAKACEAKEPQYIAHPATWLNQERWRDGKVTDRPTVTIERPASAAIWNGNGEKLAALIGEAAFQAWFGDASLQLVPSPKISVESEFKRDWIARNFPTALRRVFGEYELTVSERPANAGD